MESNLNELVTYDVTEATIAQIRADYMPLQVLAVDDADGYELCNNARKEVKTLRCAVESRRKELKADSLAFGRLVDGKAKELTAQLSEVEEHLRVQCDIVDKEKERIAQEAERERKAKIQMRVALLQELEARFDVDYIRLINDAEFKQILEQAETAYKEKIAARLAEQARLAELEQEREQQAKKIAEQEAEAKRLRDALIAKQQEELKEKQAELAAVRKAEQEAREQAAALAQEKAKQEHEEWLAHQRAAAAIANAERFEKIKTKFPTLELAWTEIARLENAIAEIEELLANG